MLHRCLPYKRTQADAPAQRSLVHAVVPAGHSVQQLLAEGKNERVDHVGLLCEAVCMGSRMAAINTPACCRDTKRMHGGRCGKRCTHAHADTTTPVAAHQPSSQFRARGGGRGLPSRAARARSTLRRPPVSTRPASAGTGSTELSRACLRMQGRGGARRKFLAHEPAGASAPSSSHPGSGATG